MIEWPSCRYLCGTCGKPVRAHSHVAEPIRACDARYGTYYYSPSTRRAAHVALSSKQQRAVGLLDDEVRSLLRLPDIWRTGFDAEIDNAQFRPPPPWRLRRSSRRSTTHRVQRALRMRTVAQLLLRA